MYDFPQYRKLSNGKAFYVIESERSFTEYQLMGTKVWQHKVEATQYPEIIRIQDMLKCEPPFLEAEKAEILILIQFD